MNDEQDFHDLPASEELELNLEAEPAESPKEATKKAVKKATKKVAKKAAKKATKKTVKKAAKKAAKKATKKATPKLKKVAEKVEEDVGVVDSLQKEVVSKQDETQLARDLEVSNKAAHEDTKSDFTEQIKMVEEPRLEQSEQTESPKKQSKPEKEIAPPPPPPEVPEFIDLTEFRQLSLNELHQEIERLPIRIPNQPTKAQLIYTILSCYAIHGTQIMGEGILEMVNDRYGMLRAPERSFKHSPDDLYLPLEAIKEYNLREGQLVKASIRPPERRDKYLVIGEVLEIEGVAREEYMAPTPYDFLTSLFPEERFVLELEDDAGLAVRVVDLVAPLGKGQRGLIVAPPRGGKTILLKQIAKSIQKNHPESELIVLLLDERPEEVTDFEDLIDGNVYSSTFDEVSKRHAQVASLVLERSRRLVEQGKDVVILLDSLTRLARGYNNSMRGGPIGSGGISPKAITETRKFFGAARNVEQGGSLTILATCLVETESRMDDVIFEELKGTGNMEVRLDRELAEQRIYPAIHIPQSGTRNDDRLYHPEEFPRVLDIRRHLAALPIGEALQTLLNGLARTNTNTELLLKGMR